MASQISSLLLVVLLLIGCSFSQEAGDVQIDITFNPCTFKVCKEGEKCRVVVQSKLLEVPIGVCVKEKNKVKSHQHSVCVSHSYGTNILNCKTETEWRNHAERKCNRTGKVLRFHKIKHLCHNVGITRYMKSEVTCCNSKSDDRAASVGPPLVMTSPPPYATDVPTSNDDESAVTPSTTTTTGEVINESNSSTQDDLLNVNFYLPILLGISAVVIILVLVAFCAKGLQRKRQLKQMPPADDSPTVIVNPYCDSHEFVFETNDISSTYQPAPSHLSAYNPAPKFFT